MKILVLVAGIVAAVALTLVLVVPSEDPAASFPEEEPTNEVRGEATIGQILRDPANFADQTVVVRGAAALPLGREGGFVLRSEGRQILVYAPSGVPRLEPGETIGVRAEVVRFTEPAAQLLGDALDDPGRLDAVPTQPGDPYLVFRALEPNNTGLAPNLRPGRARLAAVAEFPRSYYGDAVTVAGEVTRRGRRAFVLTAGRRELLVVPQEPLARELQEGVLVRAKGLVEPFDSDRSDALLDEPAIFERYDGRASLAATVVSVFAG